MGSIPIVHSSEPQVLWKLLAQVIAEPPLGDGRKMKRIKEQFNFMLVKWTLLAGKCYCT